MPDDIEAAALHARLEAIIKEAEDAEAQAVAARHCVQDARLLLEEESKAAALEQTDTTARQHVPSSSSSSSSPAVASQLIPTAASTYEDTVVAGLSGGRSAQHLPAGEHQSRLLLHQLCQLA
jgi:hypothetical protein